MSLEKKASKRKRPTDDSTRPLPVPPPPVALVSLLKSNKGVLKYFTLLQANLDADVQKWKTRANMYKEECEDLKAQLGQASINTTKLIPAKQRTIERKEASKSTPKTAQKFTMNKSPKTVSVTTPLKKKKREDSISAVSDEPAMQGETVTEINDSIFEDMLNELSSSSDDDSKVIEQVRKKEERSNSFSLLLSSDEGEDDDNKANDSKADEPLQKKREKSSSFSLILSSDEEEDDENNHENNSNSNSNNDESSPKWQSHSNMILCLRKARDSLQLLGVTLTETVITSKEEENLGSDSPLDSQKIESTPQVFIRRSDQDVANQLFFALRSVTKVQKELPSHQPFSQKDLIPCYQSKSHPAHQAYELVFDALVTMDIFCGLLLDEEWELIFHGDDRELSVGMKNRKDLVRRMMDSLHGEIVDHWPLADRAARVLTTAMHFDSNDETLQSQEKKIQEGFGSKSQGRISWLAERSLLARLLVRLYIQRLESHEAISLIIQYIASSAPSLGQSNYPRYPPVLSICVFEAMLYCDAPYFNSLLASYPPLLNAVSVIIRTTSAIWKKRLESMDNRITDIARVELASFQRLLMAEHSWFGGEPSSLLECQSQLDKELRQLHDVDEDEQVPREAFILSNQLLLVLHGDLNLIYERMTECIESTHQCLRLENHVLVKKLSSIWGSMEAHTSSYRQLIICNLDRYREEQGTIHPSDEIIKVVNLLHNLLKVTTTYAARSTNDDEVLWLLVRYTLRSLASVSDGQTIYKTIALAMNLPTNKQHVPFHDLLMVGQMPTVRIITLERRCDRWNSCISQALSERLLVVKAVAKYDSDELWGQHAFDGLGRTHEVEQRLSNVIGQPLTTLVEAKWRPMDLLAFDHDARKDEELVPMSPSERACALSHLCSWKGVQRSFELKVSETDTLLPPHLLRLYRISGFARGPALLHSNDAMPPTPVCVILEDDAILVDRFVDRLELLLDELPRDFHFCSIGYSRPRTAPMVEVSSQIGIPTCLWYLTGYILSLEGSKYLLNSLPIVGPVDSWVGLKMMSNWDNIYGQQIGVGVHAQQNTKTPSKKELGKICKFRAFAALVPLCNQKTHLQKLEGVSGRNWRQRDTDVTFSGR